MNIRRWILLLASAVSMQVSAGEFVTLEALYEAVDHSDFSNMYASSQAALNPCLDADGDAVKETQEIFESRRSELPPGACGHPGFRLLVRRLFALQLLALAATDRPVELDAAITANRRELRRCAEPECGVKVLEAAMPQFAGWWLRSLAPAPEVRERPEKTRVIRFPEKWLKTHNPRMLSAMRELCFDARLRASSHSGHGKDQIVDVWCPMEMGNGVNAPYGMLIGRGGRWRQMLPPDSISSLVTLPTVRHGYPDLMASQRVNAGEHPTMVYAFNGRTYKLALWLDIQGSDLGSVAIQ